MSLRRMEAEAPGGGGGARGVVAHPVPPQPGRHRKVAATGCGADELAAERWSWRSAHS